MCFYTGLCINTGHIQYVKKYTVQKMQNPKLKEKIITSTLSIYFLIFAVLYWH